VKYSNNKSELLPRKKPLGVSTLVMPLIKITQLQVEKFWLFPIKVQ
jgi:hypothetical protein